MKLIILGAGACGFLRMYDILKKHTRVSYKTDKVKFQNGFEIWDKKLGLTWEDAINKRERAQNYFNNLDECNISHIPIKYVDELLALDPTIKFLCLKGTKEHQVKSLMIHWGYRSPVFSKRNKYRSRYVLEQFPDYSNEENVVKATEKYYDNYYSLASKLEKRYPMNFLTVDSKQLFEKTLPESIKFILCNFLRIDQKFFNFEKQEINFTEETPTTTLHGGLGNNLFQMAETIAFAEENKLKKPTFGTWDFSGKTYPKNYYPDRFLGGHSGSQEDIVKTFKNLNWKKEIGSPTYDTKFSINDMFDFQSVHHMRDKILEAFEPTDETKKYVMEKYNDLSNGKETVSLHLRMCGLPADDHHVSVPLFYHQKALEGFSDDVVVLVFSDNNLLAENYLENLEFFTRKKFILVKENQFNSLFLMAACNNHILHVSTLSFWGAYLDKEQKGKTYYHKNFTKIHTDRMIPYKEWIMIE